MQIPVAVRNLQFHSSEIVYHMSSLYLDVILTASGSNFASRDEKGFNHHVRGIRMTPSMIA